MNRLYSNDLGFRLTGQLFVVTTAYTGYFKKKLYFVKNRPKIFTAMCHFGRQRHSRCN